MLPFVLPIVFVFSIFVSVGSSLLVSAIAQAGVPFLVIGFALRSFLPLGAVSFGGGTIVVRTVVSPCGLPVLGGGILNRAKWFFVCCVSFPPSTWGSSLGFLRLLRF